MPVRLQDFQSLRPEKHQRMTHPFFLSPLKKPLFLNCWPITSEKTHGLKIHIDFGKNDVSPIRKKLILAFNRWLKTNWSGGIPGSVLTNIFALPSIRHLWIQLISTISKGKSIDSWISMFPLINLLSSQMTPIRAAIPDKKILKWRRCCNSHVAFRQTERRSDWEIFSGNIWYHLSKVLGTTVKFADDCIGESANEIGGIIEFREVLLLENLLFYKGGKRVMKPLQENWQRSEHFMSMMLFGTDRAHASTAVIAKFFREKMFWLCNGRRARECWQGVESSCKKKNHSPLSWAEQKVSDKILIIEQLLNKVDNLLIGGGIYSLFKTIGGNISSSLCEEDKLDLALRILELARQKEWNLCCR